MSPDAKNTGVSSANQADFARLMWMPAVQETVPEAFGKPEEIQAKGTETDVEGAGTAVARPEPVQKTEDAAALKSGYCVVVASAISERTQRVMSNGFIRKVTKRRKYIKKEIWCVWFSRDLHPKRKRMPR